MDELLARALDYREYRLVSTKGDCQDPSVHAARSRRKADDEKRPHDISDSDPIALLSSSARFNHACDFERGKELTAVCCFQFYVKNKVD